MNIDFKITFSFNSDNLEISNLKITKSELNSINELSELDLKEEKSNSIKTKRSKKDKKDSNFIYLEDNKLVLSQELVNILDAVPGDRLIITFKEKDEKYFPVISKSEIVADSNSGNKLTKSLTLSYRGKQQEELLIYGNKFRYEELTPGSKICKLIGDKEITPDNNVIKDNKDIITFNEDSIENEIKDNKKTYIRELKTSDEINEDEDDLDMSELDLDDINEIDESTLLNLLN